jgi:prefoldin alpha subunit
MAPVGSEQVLAQYEYYRGQVEAFNQNLQMIETSLIELELVKEGLEEIASLGKENEILVPMGGTVFIPSRVLDPQRVILSLGANVAAEKPVSEAQEDIERRIQELEKVRQENQGTLQTLLKTLDELTPKVQEILSATQRGE